MTTETMMGVEGVGGVFACGNPDGDRSICGVDDGDGDDNVIVNRTDSDDGNDADESDDDDDDDDDGGICGNEVLDCVVGDGVGAENEDEDNIEADDIDRDDNDKDADDASSGITVDN